MQSKYKEFSYAWRIVLASAVGIGLGMSPIPIYTLGVFAGPLSAEFGWGIDKVFSALPILTLCALVLSPLVGLLTDKIGARRVVIGSVVGFSVGLMLHAVNQGSLALYLTLWALVALLGVGTLPITWTRVINNWFSECKGLALGCALVATGLFGIFVKFYVAFLIDAVGWRMAFVGLGILPLVTSLPLVYFLFRDVSDPKVPAAQKRILADKPSQVVSGLLASEAFKDWRFWLMSACFVAISFGVGGLIPNLESLFNSKGFEQSDAVILASLIGVSVVVGRLSGGFLIDNFWAPGVAVCMLLVPAASCYFLIQPDLTFTVAAISVLLIGLTAGAEQDLMAFMVARYFGMRSYGVVYGVLYSCFALGAGSGPWLLGKEFATTGTYDNALVYIGIAFVAGSLPLLLLGKYRDFSTSKES
ncbi:MFS transporter [Paraglaciecola sp. 2405UD69-4]|uniref:MFS transporter n=1 Tax=Paraglaciecola sp. 2405UD69-4 TaxID=3391836 RepID=UPI0039C900C7